MTAVHPSASSIDAVLEKIEELKQQISRTKQKLGKFGIRLANLRATTHEASQLAEYENSSIKADVKSRRSKTK